MKKYIPALLAIILLTGACTKEEGILERPAYAFYEVTFSINTTAERFFELVVDDEVVSDSISTNKKTRNKIAAGSHHFKLRQPGSSTFFLDTVLTLDKAKTVVFDFININPNGDPVSFSSKETEAPVEGFYKFSLLNVDPATSTLYGKNLDISFYEVDLNTFELKFAAKILLPRSKFSDYLELPYSYATTPDAVYVLGITDHDTGEVLANELDYNFIFEPLSLTDPKYNTYELTFSGSGTYRIISEKKL